MSTESNRENSEYKKMWWIFKSHESAQKSREVNSTKL